MTDEGRAFLEAPHNRTTKARAFRRVKREMGYGATAKDVADWFNVHHGSASSALSMLHEEGLIERLAEKRNRFSVYVLPEHVRGRDTIERKHQKGDNSGHVKAAGLRDVMEDALQVMEDPRRPMANIIDTVEEKLRKALKDFA